MYADSSKKQRWRQRMREDRGICTATLCTSAHCILLDWMRTFWTRDPDISARNKTRVMEGGQVGLAHRRGSDCSCKEEGERGAEVGSDASNTLL